MKRTAAGLLLLALLAGCGGGDEAADKEQAGPSAAEKATTELVRAAVDPKKLKGFTQAEKPSTSLDKPSFEYCTEKWKTDDQRLAQVTRTYVDKKASLGVGETLIRYKAGQAEKAFAEFDRAIDRCRKFPNPEEDGGGTTRAARIVQRPKAAKGVPYAGVAFALTQGGRVLYGTQLVVRRGDTIVIDQAASGDPQAAGTAAASLLLLSKKQAQAK